MTSSSSELFARAIRCIPGGVNSPVRAFRSVGGNPFFTAKANGATLTTVDGDELIDFVGTWGPAIHGHNHPVIRKALHDAVDKGTSFGTPNPLEVRMAETIAGVFKSIESVRMVNSGTEATMSAIRLARGYTGRNKIVKFAGCYHGHSDSLLVKAGSGALTCGNPDSAGVPALVAAQTIVLPFNSIDALDAAFALEGQDIACVILEPYPANMGLVLPLPDYLSQVRDRCSRNGSLLIFDEVMTGFRISLSGVQGIEPVVPDLTTLGKIIGGGLPVGAFGGPRHIMEHLAPTGPVYQAGTLSGNPLALSAGLAAIELLEQHDPYNSLAESTRRIVQTLITAFAKKGISVKIPYSGSMFSLFFSETEVRQYEDVLKTRSTWYKPFFNGALKRGVFVPPSAYETWFVSTAHESNIIDKACEALAATVAALEPES